jgi:uncharacterized protein YjiK
MKFIIVSLMVFVSISSCFLDNDIDKGQQQELSSEAYKVYNTSISGLSGVYFYQKTGNFLAVSDNTGIFEIDIAGNIIRKFPYSGSNDFEGITINNLTGDIYLADEGLMVIYQLSRDEMSVSKVTDVSISGAIFNKGIEGLSFGNDTLYIVNQESPKLLIKYDLKSKKEISRHKMEYAVYLSDIFYDGTDKSLWICDSKQKKIFHTDLNGSLIGTQLIDYVNKAEAIFVDRPAGFVWVGCDETGNLYKIKLTI